MTVIQQQRLIGATLVVLLVAVLAWLVLASVDTQDSDSATEPDEPIVFKPVVEPIDEEMTVAEGSENNSESTVDESGAALSQQSEAKVVIPAQDIDNESSADEAPTPTNSVSTASDHEVPETSAKDELTALAEELATAETQTQPQTETPSESESQQLTADKNETETDASPQNAAGDDRPQWLIQLGSFSKPENAQSLQRQLQESDYEAVIEEAEIDGRTIYRVRLPADDDRPRLEETAAELAESLGLKPQILIVNP